MWFKNAAIYKITKGLPDTCEVFSSELAEKVLQACPQSQPHSTGWISPFGKDSEVLAHAVGPYWLFGLGREERLLPATIVREALQERITEIEQQFERRVYGKEKAALRDDIQFELLAKAFIRRKNTWAYLDTERQLLVVDVSSDTKADEFTVLLQETTDIRLELIAVETNVATLLTRWILDQQAPGNFTIAEDCVMADNQREIGRVRFANQDLTAHDVIEVVKTDRKVTELGLIWHDRIKLRLCQAGPAGDSGNRMVIKGIKFLDIVKEQQEELEIANSNEKLDADFAIMSYELSAMVHELFSVVGIATEKAASEKTEVREPAEV